MKILITGAGGGVGSTLIKQFSKANNLLFLHSHRRIITQNVPSQHRAYGDLTRESNLDQLVKLVKKYGGIDVIIHAASFPTDAASAIDKQWLDYEQHLLLQTKSLFLLVKALAPAMIEQKFGRIIGVATEYIAGRPPRKLADYVTAKYAMVGLIKSLAVELGEFGITCNCVSPGTMDTKMTANLPRKLLEIITYDTPTRRLTTPTEVAQLVDFLCSAAAAQINGENIILAGGHTME